MFFFLSFFALFFNYAFSIPTSNIDAGTGYLAPCFLGQIGAENVSSVTLNTTQIPFNQLDSVESLKTPHGTKISLNCSENNYVFEPERAISTNPRTSFEMECIKGVFKKKISTDFCDAKCELTPLKSAGYRIPPNLPLNSLSPGQTVPIFCPTGQTTREGEGFEITCQSNGLLNAKSPSCFTKQTSCTHQGINFPEGSKLSCNKTGYGFTLITCENGAWEDKALYNSPDGKTCKETVAELNFSYENINAVILEELENALTIEEFVDFCKQNPKDPDCKKELPKCEFNGIQYEFSHILRLKCPRVGNKEVNYQCFNGWIFTGYQESKYFFEPALYIQDCGAGAEITFSLAPEIESSRSLSSPQNSKTLKDAQMQKLRQSK